MTRDTGVAAAKALEVLATLGHDRKQVATQVDCHPRTVARWEAGQFSPNRRNRTALRAFVGQLLMVALAGPDTARTEARRKRLNLAAEALMTAAEKAERAEFEQSMRDRYTKIIAQRQSPTRSITHDIDPFELVRTGQPF